MSWGMTSIIDPDVMTRQHLIRLDAECLLLAVDSVGYTVRN
jgi:hypothetical protein